MLRTVALPARRLVDTARPSRRIRCPDTSDNTTFTATLRVSNAFSSYSSSSETDTTDSLQHERFMDEAVEQAKLAYAHGEVPVGAVLVNPDGHVVSRGFNKTEAEGDPTSHAELNVIRQATGSLAGGWRLLDCTLYVTLEPCPMCAGAILQARVGTVVYGARNTLLGADGSWIRMFDRQRPHPFHPGVRIIRGVREEACGQLMKDFFRSRRA